MGLIERSVYTNHIINMLGKGVVVVLTGHRRAGKSCILENLGNLLRERGNVMFLDMEKPENVAVCDWEKLHTWIDGHRSTEKHNYLLIDEIQEIPEFERTLRWWVKQDGFDIIVTGSNAMMLSSEIASAFAGRYFQIHVYSLSFKEFLLFHGLQPSQETLMEYLQWGGLPFLHHIPMDDARTRGDYLGSIYDTIFVRDILNRRQIRNVTFIDNLTRFVADNSGKLFSANSIAKYMKAKESAVSSNTISDYMEMLCRSYMIDKVPRYDIKGKRLFEQQEKYYFEDLGVRNYLCRDKGHWDLEKVLENAVYLQLRRLGYTVYVGQLDGKEIDFVAKRGNETAYYQVSLQISAPETYEREFGNLKQIRDNYPKYVITMDAVAPLANDDGILVLPVQKFLLRDVCRDEWTS